MRGTAFKPVFTKPGRYSQHIRDSRGKAGVYLIKNPRGKLVYIGMSETNLYGTLTRHFQAWNDPTQKRTVYPQEIGYKARIIYTRKDQAAALERALIIKHRPRDNPNKLEQYTLASLTKTQNNYLQQIPADSVPF